MKKVSFIAIFAVLSLASSCNIISDNKNKELYETTDQFVSSLKGEVYSYGMFNSEDYKKTLENWTVTPIGRLINVKINKYASDDEYNNLKEQLKNHLSNDGL